jgi:predicted dehydrogenase
MTRVAIIGAGLMGEVHGRSCARLPDVSVTWVADQDRMRAEVLAAEVGGKTTTDNERAIGADDVDAVIVTVPTPAHRTVVEMAAAHGKDVFCEKPIARTLEDAEAMVTACDQAGVRLMVGHVVRFFPEYARIHEVLQAGTLGQIGVARASRVNLAPQSQRGWYGSLEASGGLIVDMMIHDLDTLSWYFGDLSRVFAHGLSYTPHQGTADYALAVLRFTNGVIAHVESSWAHASFRTAIEIAGEYGTIRHNGEASAAIRVERSGPNPHEPLISRRAALAEPGHQIELRHFFARLADGQPFLTGGREAILALELALSVLASVRTGKPIDFVNGHPNRADIEETAA